MPIEVDVDARLREIAEATLTVASRDGAEAVTIRAVAHEMGHSTKVVTNYVPSRAALLVNATNYARQRWSEQAAAVLGSTSGVERLKALARWTCSTETIDEAARRLWVEMLVAYSRHQAFQDTIRDEARSERTELRELAAQAGLPEVDRAADALYLAFRGYFISTIEDAEEWPGERAAAAVELVIELLTGLVADGGREQAVT